MNHTGSSIAIECRLSPQVNDSLKAATYQRDNLDAIVSTGIHIVGVAKYLSESFST